MLPPEIIEKEYLRWLIGYTSTLSSKQLDYIIKLADQPTRRPTPQLGGRSRIHIGKIDGMGNIVVKAYLRGGIMRYLLKDTYLKTSGCRARLEFEMLLAARVSNINVPEPVLYLQKGYFFYQCWIVTKEIPNRGTIAQISLNDLKSIEKLMPDVRHQVKLMIQRGIHHVDFHPGNVIAGLDGKIYLLDFDKAYSSKTDPSLLAKKYVLRWNRAVVKHCLPEQLQLTSFL